MVKCVLCGELGVATTATTTSSEAFSFLCKQLGLSTSVGGGNGGVPCALCSSCHSLWEEVSVLYTNMQGLLNLMARRVTQFKKNIDKGKGDRDGHGSRRCTRGRKRNSLSPHDDESMLSWWYPSATTDSRKSKKGVEREGGLDVDVIVPNTEHGASGLEGDIKIEPTDVVEEVDLVEVQSGGGGGCGDEIEIKFEDFEIFPEDRESDGDDDGGEDDTIGDPSDDPLQSTSPSHENVLQSIAMFPKKTKPKASVKPKGAATSHPPTAEMVINAVTNLKERNGSSLQAIKKYIADTYKIEITSQRATFICKALAKLVESGKLTQSMGCGVSGYFKLSMKEKEAAGGGGEKKKVKAASPKKKAPASPKKKTAAAAAAAKPKKATKASPKKVIKKTAVTKLCENK